jgi:RND family efflux transporter MFP subunit
MDWQAEECAAPPASYFRESKVVMQLISHQPGLGAGLRTGSRSVFKTAYKQRSAPIVLLGILILLIVGMSGCGAKAPPHASEIAQKVLVRQPSRFERPLAISASGNVEAAETAYLSFQVSGQVRKVYVEEGQAVRAGQLLAELDLRDYQFRVDAAASQAGAAGATLQKVNAGPRRQELAQARVDLDRTTDEYKRLKALYDRGSLAPNDYKKIEAAWLAARERYSMAEEGSRQEDKLAAKDSFQAAQAQEGIARKALGDTRLTAPFAGVIVKRDIENGMLASSTRPVFVLMNLNPAKVRVGVPEAEIGKIRIGQRATVRIPSLGDRGFDGRVETIGYAADPAARTFAVRIAVPNPALVLRAGMVAESSIETGEKVTAMTLPGQALVRDSNGASTVFVLFPEKNRVYSRRVDVGSLFGREVEIVSGLSGGESVVVAGQQLVHDGSAVVAGQAGQAQ